MYGYVYKTTNKYNGKVYIGMHKGDKFDSTYYGSGNIITRIIDKYGVKNLQVDILEWCPTKSELSKAERRWIQYYWDLNINNSYNIHEGGFGGDTGANYTPERRLLRNKRISSSVKKYYTPEKRVEHGLKWTPEIMATVSKKAKDRYKDPLFREKVKNSNVFLRKGVAPSNKGRIYTKEDKIRLHMYGNPNGTKGTGIINKISIFKDCTTKYINQNELDNYIKDGWERGRCYRNKDGNLVGGIPYEETDPIDERIIIFKGDKDKRVLRRLFDSKYKGDGWKIWTRD